MPCAELQPGLPWRGSHILIRARKSILFPNESGSEVRISRLGHAQFPYVTAGHGRIESSTSGSTFPEFHQPFAANVSTPENELWPAPAGE